MASIGIGPGKTFEFKDLSLEHKAAVLLAMKEGDGKVDAFMTNGMNGRRQWLEGRHPSSAMRAFFNGDWLKRAAAAKGRHLWQRRRRGDVPDDARVDVKWR
jgi:hypothetical protein